VRGIDVVVCARNNELTIKQSLKRILAYASPRRLIVIDGLSHDRTVDIATDMGAEVYTDNGRGLGFARNMGLRLSKTSIVGFVDADAYVPSNWLDLCKHLKNPKVAAASATTIYGYGNPPLQKLHEWIAKTSGEDIGFVGTVVRRKIILNAGGIREDLQAAEDWELKARLEAQGFEWVRDRRVVNLHPISMSSFLKHFRHWGRGARKSGVVSRKRALRSFVISPIWGLRLARAVHPIHAAYYPMMRLWFLIGYLESA